jgi:hypothetical protein
MRETADPIAALPAVRPVRLDLITTASDGITRTVGPMTITRYEARQTFDADDFATPDGRERIYSAVLASAAFPVVYQPVERPELGPCVDGAPFAPCQCGPSASRYCARSLAGR